MNLIKNNLVIELHVPDFSLVRDFYSKLGFVQIYQEETGELPGYLVLQREDELGKTILNFYGDDERVYNQSYFKKFPKETVRGYAVELTVPVFGIEDFFSKIKKEVPESVVQNLIVKKAINKEWRDFRLVDPFGFYLRFTEPLDWGQS